MKEQDYAAVIPVWCGYKTLQQHLDMMLCWSLVPYAERGEKRPYETCVGCDLLDKTYVPFKEPSP